MPPTNIFKVGKQHFKFFANLIYNIDLSNWKIYFLYQQPLIIFSKTVFQIRMICLNFNTQDKNLKQNVYFLFYPDLIVFLKIIGKQKQLPIQFDTSLKHIKTSKVTNPLHTHTQNSNLW